MNKLGKLMLFVGGGILPVYGGDDKLRFTNGDQLHGKFEGMADGDSILWKRNDVEGQMKFKLTDVRHVLMADKKDKSGLVDLSYVGTINGDRIPGEVTDLNGTHVTVNSLLTGPIQIPREQVGMIAPNPLGGRMLYYGPFDKEGWLMVDTNNPDGIPEVKEGEKDKFENNRWKFTGSEWYWDQKAFGTGLLRKTGMPDQTILQFDVTWKGRLSLAVGFHADFKKSQNMKPEDDEGFRQMGRSSSITALFGNSYMLHLYSHYVTLFKTTVDEDGSLRSERIQGTQGAVRLGDTGKTTVEIRCNRKSGEIHVFVGGQFVGQWMEGGDDGAAISEYAGLGDGFGFVVQMEDSPIKVSEVMVREWNGMPDSAKSLQAADADMVLMTNGRDRFSGKVTEISEKMLKIQSKFADFVLPMEDVSEVRFAKSGLADKKSVDTDLVKVGFEPAGRISGKPMGGSDGRLKVIHDSIGEMEINLGSARILEFQEKGAFVDDWDEDF